MAAPLSPARDAPRSIVVGTAGHIDHGKTALIRALTGIDTDRLPEEKRRGITIDLGFASLQAQARDGSPLQISFIDVPGHARFVRNMLAGAGGIDAVLLAISAEEAVKPQTQEHLAICSLLGIARGITVLTKADAVNAERLDETTSAVRHFLRDTFLASAPLIAVSAHTGSGIAQLRDQLIRLSENLPQRSIDTVLRLPIDRAFAMKGFGTVVTGTLVGGSVNVGDELRIEPSGTATKVRGLQIHGYAAEHVDAGCRVALNLTRVETVHVGRGKMLVAPASLRPVNCIDVELTVLPGAPPLKHRARLHCHAFTSECMATATLYDAAAVQPGERRLARLRLAEPVVLAPGDRFVLRQGSPVTTIGGGEVLDAHPLAAMRKARTAEWLQQLRASSTEEKAWLRISRRGTAGIGLQQLSLETGLSEARLRDLTQRWIGESRLHATGDRHWLTHESLQIAAAAILDELTQRTGRTQSGVKRAELKGQLRLQQDVIDCALAKLEREQKVRLEGELAMIFGAEATSSQQRSTLAAVRAEFARAALTPPSPDEIRMRLSVAAEEMRRLMTELLRDKTLIRLGSDSLCADSQALEALKTRVRALKGQQLDVAAFKQLAGVSRKYAIPLLEYLDRERVTVKRGEHRLIL